MYKVITILFLILTTGFCQAQKSPSLAPKVKAFKAGELLEYDVYYNWGLIWVNAGWVNFGVDAKKINNKFQYNLSGVGGNKPNWEWFYKVNDRYESWVDTVLLHPSRYLRNSNDGGHWVYNDTYFDFKKNLAYGEFRNFKHPELRKDTIKINYMTFDPITMIYYSRCIDFNQFKPGDVFPITIYLDNHVYYQKIKFEGREVLETELGKFNCIKFRPTLIPGTLFKEGDEMIVWVSDDDNRIPIQVQTPILVGSIKARLKKYSGLRHELKAKVK